MAEEVLLLVVVKTDQPDIQRRMQMILAAARPCQDPPNTEAQVLAFPADTLDWPEHDHLRGLLGPKAFARLVGKAD